MADVENQAGLPAEDADASVSEEIRDIEAESESSTDDVQEEKPQPKGVQKRLNELTANWREEQRRARALEEQNAELLRKVLAGDKSPESSAPAQPADAEPAPESFQTYEEYIKAVGKWSARQELKAEREQAQQREKMLQDNARLVQHLGREQKFAATVPDYDEVVRNPSLSITQTMLDEAMEMDDGPQVLYALGQNPAEAARIAELTSPRAVSRELGRFAARAAMPQPRRQTNAPAPIEPIGGGVAQPSVDPEQLDGDAWLKWRYQQLGRK